MCCWRVETLVGGCFSPASGQRARVFRVALFQAVSVMIKPAVVTLTPAVSCGV
jgi:hypothetical protein